MASDGGGGTLRYLTRADQAPEVEVPKAKRPPRAPAAKNNPEHVKAARESRDRFLEHVNTPGGEPLAIGMYEVSRTLPSALKLRLEESEGEGSRQISGANPRKISLLPEAA